MRLQLPGRDRAAAGPGPGPGPVPVEYAVAVDRYLAEASLGPASRRVYRISLTSWAWALVGRPRRRVRSAAARRRRWCRWPCSTGRRRGARLAAALAGRGLGTDARTVNRELSALRSAVGWWQDQRWISRIPTAGLRHRAGPAAPAARAHQRPGGAACSGPRPALREQALLAGHLRLGRARRRRPGPGRGPARPARRPGSRAPPAGPAGLDPLARRTSQVLGWLLAGRTYGPVFLTDRRAPARAAAADVCPVTGRARMSYRRAAEIFTAATRPLDPAGRGWTLGQLRQAGREARAAAG